MSIEVEDAAQAKNFTPDPSKFKLTVAPDDDKTWREIYLRGFPLDIAKVIAVMPLGLLISCLLSRHARREDLAGNDDESALHSAASAIRRRHLLIERIERIEAEVKPAGQVRSKSPSERIQAAIADLSVDDFLAEVLPWLKPSAKEAWWARIARALGFLAGR